jgi:hypothetical protein
MAAGDWRDWDAIRAWARALAMTLERPTFGPRQVAA